MTVFNKIFKLKLPYGKTIDVYMKPFPGISAVPLAYNQVTGEIIFQFTYSNVNPGQKVKRDVSYIDNMIANMRGVRIVEEMKDHPNATYHHSEFTEKKETYLQNPYLKEDPESDKMISKSKSIYETVIPAEDVIEVNRDIQRVNLARGQSQRQVKDFVTKKTVKDDNTGRKYGIVDIVEIERG